MKTKQPYAIGRWVSIEERLPEFTGEPKAWNGFIRNDRGQVYALTLPHWCFSGGHITHWLDIVLPEVTP